MSLLALPVVAATTLGGFRINDSLNDIQQLEHMQLLTKMTKEATALASALQTERDESAGPLSNGVKPSDTRIKNERAQTDRAQKAFLDATLSIGNTDNDDALESIRANVEQIAAQVSQISGIRKGAYATDTSHSLTVDAYDGLISSLLSLSQDMAQATSNPDMIKRTRALAAFSSAKEYASIQRAIIAAALPADPKQRGKLNENDRLYGLAAQNKETNALNSFTSLYESLGGDAQELMAPLNGQGNPEIEASEKYADPVLKSATGLASQPNRSYLDWTDQASTRINAMNTIEATLLNEMESKARELQSDSERDAIINAALIVLVLGVSLVGAFVVARSMIRSLRRLQDTATRVAQDRLPELVKQLSETDPQDVDTSVESVGVHSRDEIGQVAAAFDHVHREAVRLAAEQALLRGNVNAMFTNLSRRSQGLIQRQLSLISELESREADPDQLSSLFKLDHLATRMRRNGENLLVLAGEEPGRRWTRPVPLVDVLRAAASEVEQYERIELAAVPATEVAGRVVNDLVHLLAELLENATSFSSPQTKVRVTGHALPDGRVLVEIHDTGIGLSPEDLAAINERLASPPTVDVSVSRRMGLFVVGRLSLRHGIRIQLRPSDSGGTTALVMLPVDVAHGGKKAPVGKPGAAGPAGTAQAPAPLTAGPGGAGNRPGISAGPAGGGPGDGSAGQGRLPAGASRGQVGAGTAPRAALPARGGPQHGGPQHGGPQHGSPQYQGPLAGGPQQDPQDQGAGQTGTPNVFAQNAFGNGQSQAPAFDQQQNQGQAGQGMGQPGQGMGMGDQGMGMGQPGQGMGQQAFGNGGNPGPGGPGGQNGFGGRGQNPFPRQQQDQQGGGPRADRGRQLPPPGGPRAELPGGNPRPQRPQAPQVPLNPQTPWANDLPPARQQSSMDAPRGHEEHHSGQFPPAEQQGPGSTAEFQRPDFNGPRPDGPRAGTNQDPAATEQFARPDFNAPRPDFNAPRQDYNAPRQDYNAPQQDFGAQRQDAQPDYGSPRGPQQGEQGRPNAYAPSDYRAPSDYNAQQGPTQDQQYGRQQQDPQVRQPQAPGAQGGYQGPARRQPDALPPAGPGDGRTPLYDTLETNWFHGPQSTQGGERPPEQQQAPVAPQPQAQAPAPMPRRESARGTGNNAPANNSSGSAHQGSTTGPIAKGAGVTSSWRTSPNDELVRQAERVRKPAAGGITTSGLPRRVPRANLVPGTAQEQSNQAGPQVSRAPADVRGRLTNLRRGIEQGRQAGNTGPSNNSFNLGPSHQQER